ncbi:hypothetical protein ACQ4PT_024735 [Festuca glaucescens]
MRSPRARGTAPLPAEPWALAGVDDTCVNDVESFARTVAAVKSKPRPDMLTSVLSHYATKWLPEVASTAFGHFLLSPESPTVTWLKKRLLLESLVAALPPPDAEADDGITRDFLLRLLRAGSMVGADVVLLRELEARAARWLDQASLAAVMVPASGHAPTTLLDVPLVLRLVPPAACVDGKCLGGRRPSGSSAADGPCTASSLPILEAALFAICGGESRPAVPSSSSSWPLRQR